MKSKLLVVSSPHLKDPMTTSKLMLSVVIAMIPTAIAATVLYGLRAFMLICVCVASCIIFEYLYNVLTGQPNTVSDCSCAVTGMLLAFNLPSTFPFWMAMVGCFVAIVIVKMLFGGIGKNFANPAITARVVLLVSFGAAMGDTSAFVTPYLAEGKIAHMAGATPLGAINTTAVSGVSGWGEMISGGVEGVPSAMELLFGLRGGSLGETCIITLLIGGVYLIWKKVISPIIPVAYIGTVFVMAWLLDVNPVMQILSGGLVLGAFYMATDYSTSPVTNKGKWILGIGCGLITIVIRLFGQYVEGVSFAILLMNILTPLIDKWTRTKPFGGVKK